MISDDWWQRASAASESSLKRESLIVKSFGILKNGKFDLDLDFSMNSTPFVSELRLWELNLEIWAEKSRSRAWQ